VDDVADLRALDARGEVLHAADIVSHDLEIDGDDGRVQVSDGSHVCPS